MNASRRSLRRSPDVVPRCCVGPYRPGAVATWGVGRAAMTALMACLLATQPSTTHADPPSGKFPQLFKRGSAESAPSPEPRRELPPGQAAQACVTAAQELIAAGHAHEATLLLERARQLDPRHQGVARTLAVLYDQQGRDAQADEEYRRAIALAPRDAELLTDYGYFHYLRGDFAAAETHYRQALQQVATHARAWGNLGLALGRQGRYHEAFDAFSRSAGEAAAHANVGMLLAQAGDYVRAEQALLAALELEPELTAARAMLGHLAARGVLAQRAR